MSRARFGALVVLVATAGGLLAAGTLTGCDREALYWRSMDAEGAWVTKGAFFAWDTAREAFVRVDLAEPPGGDHPISHHPVAGDTHLVQVSPAGDELLVLTPDERTLTVLPASGTKASGTKAGGTEGDGGGPRAYPLDQPFDALAVSDDGRHAVAYAGAGSSDAAIAIGENLLAVIDLGAPPGGTNPRSQTVSSYGGERLGIDISPSFTVNGAPHRLAVIRSVGHVALLDLEAPGSAAISVPLVVPGDPVDLRPQPARFSVREEGSGGLWVLLWASGDGDVIALDVSAAIDGGGGLRATLNQHAVGGWVTDAVPVRDAGGRLLVAALSGPSRRLALIDIASGETRTFTFDVDFGHIERFDVQDTESTTTRPYVLLSGAGTPHFAVLAIDEVPQKGAKAMRLRSLRQPYDTIAPIPNTPRFVAFDREGRGLTLVWLEREAAEDSFAFSGTVLDRAFSADGALLHVLVTGGALGDHLVNLRLSDGALSELPLDGNPTALHVVPDSGRLVVVHDDRTGLLTYSAPDALDRPGAERILGFLLDGFLGD